MLGLAPNPYLRANMARSICVALLLVFITSTLLFLLSARLGVAQQSINICLDGNDLLHIPARFLILSILAVWQLAQLLLSENFCQSKFLKNGAGLQGHRPFPRFHYPPDIVYFRYFFNLQATV